MPTTPAARGRGSRLRWGAAALAAIALPLTPPAPGHAAAADDRPPARPGYLLAGRDGGVFAYGAARFRGSAAPLRPARPVVGVGATPAGSGYWLATDDGGVFAFGDAGFHGSTGGIRLVSPVVTFAPTPSGTGYWLAAADGGVFGFGDAGFHGSTGGIRLARPVVAMAPTPTGRGYWLAAADGGVFAFGDAVFHGSTGGIPLRAPIVSIAPTRSGSGYWLAAADGGVFAFGDAAFHGSTGGIRLARPVVAMAPSGNGYWLMAADGGVFGFGDATFLGGLGGAPLAAPIAAATAAPVPAPAGTAIFYYPWHANPAVDGEWRHWGQGGHQPPEDIGSEYYPVRGAYSNADPAVIAEDMATVAAMGLDTVVVSWWGTGSYEDARLPAVAAEARRAGLAVGAILEPYPGRSPTRAAGDLGYLEAHGIRDVYVYEVLGEDMAAWRAATHVRPGMRIFAQGSDPWGMRSGALVERARRGGFDGVFTYDPLGYGPPDYAQVCAQARAHGLLCAPSVAPGFETVRATGRAAARPRDGGGTFDRHWEGALYASPDVVTVTSWNEWHEGTQIEPARPRQCLPGGGWCYLDYAGAYGRTGQDAPRAYVERTAHWVQRIRTADSDRGA